MYEEDFHMHITKVCVGCGNTYPRRRKFSQTQWDSQKYCTRPCGNKYVTGGGWWYQERNKNVMDRKI